MEWPNNRIQLNLATIHCYYMCQERFRDVVRFPVYYGCITQATSQLQLTVKVGHICFDLYSCNLSNCLFQSEKKNVIIYTKTCWKRKFENFEIVYYCRVYIYKLDIRYSESYPLIKVTNSPVQDVSTVKGLSGRIVKRRYYFTVRLKAKRNQKIQ